MQSEPGEVCRPEQMFTAITFTHLKDTHSTIFQFIFLFHTSLECLLFSVFFVEFNLNSIFCGAAMFFGCNQMWFLGYFVCVYVRELNLHVLVSYTHTYISGTAHVRCVCMCVFFLFVRRKKTMNYNKLNWCSGWRFHYPFGFTDFGVAQKASRERSKCIGRIELWNYSCWWWRSKIFG